ncbi:hypothetical protein PAPHI01_0901 [Pancytospora philotis]|nr:hypothetical protein PAPHI01_0901 [Pancytospora philotis]
MKAYEKDKQIIAIQRNPTNREEMEEKILGIRDSLAGLRAACADRNTEDFPHETVQRIAALCSEIRQEIMDVPVENEYLERAVLTRSVPGYFEEKLNGLREEEAAWKRKKAAFKRFSEKLRILKETHFS